MLRRQDSTGLDPESVVTKKSTEKSTKEDAKMDQTADEAPDGSRVSFVLLDDRAKNTPFRFENTVKIGGKFFCFPLCGKEGSTREEVAKGLVDNVDRATGPLPSTDAVVVQQVEIYKPSYIKK